MKKKIKIAAVVVLVLAALFIAVHTYLNEGIIVDTYHIPILPKLAICGLMISIAVTLFTAEGFKQKKRLKKVLTVLASVGIFVGSFAVLLLGGMVGYQNGVGVPMLQGSMDISDYADQWQYDGSHHCYILNRVVYVEDPVSPMNQSLTIVVPEAYMNKDGSINHEATVNGYTADTAPIIYQNGVSGYASAMPSTSFTTSAEYLEHGYVFVSVGSRGKDSVVDGVNVGKSPEGLVDLKAGVRFLKANSGNLCGDTEKIITVGWSAGGAMSSLLGTTGDYEAYDAYLEEIGAIMDSSDSVYASMCYCPIIDLENADAAYAWMYAGYDSNNDAFNAAVAEKLAERYIAYVNGYGLTDPETGDALVLDGSYDGSLYDYMTRKMEEAATKFLSQNKNADSYVSKYSWLSWDGTTAKIESVEAMLGAKYVTPLKSTLAFDSWKNDSAENLEFGSETVDVSHFDTMIPAVLEDLKDSYPAEYETYYEAFRADAEDPAKQEQVYLLNPMNFVGNDSATKAQHFRIRVGTQDTDTSWLVGLIFGIALDNQTDATVDMSYVWDKPHTMADYEGEFCQWIDSICK